jgi:hypothetical protein
MPQSVILNIVPTAGGQFNDNLGSRQIIFNSSVESAGTYSFTMASLTTIVDDVDEVFSESPAQALVDGAHYRLQFLYRDVATNDPVDAGSQSVIFAGAQTLAPTLSSPVGFVPENFDIDMFLPEDALATTLRLIIDTVSGSEDVSDSVTTRTVELDVTVAGAAGSHLITMSTLSTATNLAAVTSVTPDTDLVDGAKYDFILKYQDRGGNDFAQVVQAGVGFAGENTLTQTFRLPAANSYLGQPWAYDFKLPETASGGTVKMIFTPDDANSGILDTNGARTILFSNAHESPGTHTGTIGDLPSAHLLGAVTSVTPSTSLVDGAAYTVETTYQDSLSNPASVVAHSRVYFAGTTTISPSLFEPAGDDFIPQTFKVSFEIKEDATADSVKLIITRTGTCSGGSSDSNSPHTLELSSAHEILGVHNITVPALSSAPTDQNSGNSIDSVSPVGADLVDGCVYSMRIEYQDRAANPVAFDLNRFITFDTTKPTADSAILDLNKGL